MNDNDEHNWTFPAKIALATAVVVLVLLVVYAPQALLLIFAGVVFGVFLRRLGGLVARLTGFPAGASLALVAGVLVLAFIGFFALLGWQAVEQADQLAESLSKAGAGFLDRIKEYPAIRRTIDEMPSPAKAAGRNLLSVSSIRNLLGTPLGFVVNGLFIFFTGVYLAAQPGPYRAGLVRLFPTSRRDDVRRTLDNVEHALWWWTLGQMSSMALTGLLTGIALSILGIPLAWVLGVLTGLLVFIPNVGAVLAVIPPTLLAFQQGGWMPLYVVLVYIGVQLVESYVLTPLIQERGVKILPAVVLSAQLLAGVLVGIIGVALATPLVVAGIVVVRDFYIRDVLESGQEE